MPPSPVAQAATTRSASGSRISGDTETPSRSTCNEPATDEDLSGGVPQVGTVFTEHHVPRPAETMA